LASITREINRLLKIPVMVLYRYRDFLTIAIINRRPNKKDSTQDVLEKVTLIKDICISKPHRAHTEILFDLSLPVLAEGTNIHNFIELQVAWQKALDSAALNKKFYQEISNWYHWATRQVVFPKGDGENEETRNAVSVIRLITRMIFIWFLKEKGLVPEELFNKRKIDELLTYQDAN
jgi:adenine-specific DNA-methyltransferase